MIGAIICAILSIFSAFLFDAFLSRWVSPIALNTSSVTLSERSLQTLNAVDGTISVASIFPQEDSLGLPTGQLLRAFQTAANEFKHVEMRVDYVDPLVDVAEANALKAKGAGGQGVLFYQAGRSVFVSIRDLCGHQKTFDPIAAEEAFTAAILRLSRAEELRVGWVVNHGEPDFKKVDLAGYSGLQSALQLEGFSLQPVVIDTTTIGKALPEDISILMVVAPHYAFSNEECTALTEWVERGGRLFFALPASGEGGLTPLLDRWGIGVGSQPLTPSRTVTGGAGLTDIFSPDHDITCDFSTGVTTTFVAPRALQLTPAENVTSHSLVEMAQSTQVLPTPIMVAAERGGDLAADLVPTLGRIVVVGESNFFTNRYMLNRATANRDLFMNTMRWLADVPGSNAHGASNVLRIGQDSNQWFNDTLVLVLCFPIVFVFFASLIFRRHR